MLPRGLAGLGVRGMREESTLRSSLHLSTSPCTLYVEKKALLNDVVTKAERALLSVRMTSYATRRREKRREGDGDGRVRFEPCRHMAKDAKKVVFSDRYCPEPAASKSRAWVRSGE